MKQVVQNLRSGQVRVLDCPRPKCGPGDVLVANRASLISIGTERSLVELGRKSLASKARARPDLVRRMIEKAKVEGVVSTVQQAFARLDQPLALGYSSAGVVVEVGERVTDLKPGQRVACVGQGFASHAEVVSVPRMLCTPLTDAVSFEEAAFGMVGAIALHGIRCGKLTFGEKVGVVGLGLLGLVTAQMLRAYGCRVVASDPDEAKLELARSLGITDVASPGQAFMDRADGLSGGLGLDAVLLTLATQSSEPVDEAIRVAREGGRIVLVGVASLRPDRNEMWKKEVELVVSRAAGPGSFDPVYEREAVDYPAPFVRWTEARNVEEFVRLVADGLISVGPLITHRYRIDQAPEVYSDLVQGGGGSHVGVLFEYGDLPVADVAPSSRAPRLPSKEEVGIGVIGAGTFGQSVLLPALAKVPRVRLVGIATSSGVNAAHVQQRFGFRHATTEYRELIGQDDVDAVMVLTRHSLHAEMVCAALDAGKAVFVEKPLCVTPSQLRAVQAAQRGSGGVLFVGYNRRYAKATARLKALFHGVDEPLVLSYLVNAGFVPVEHWVHRADEGGGRIIGEMCHFLDLMQCVCEETVTEVTAQRVGRAGAHVVANDNVVLSFSFSGGSVGSVVYSGAGDRSAPRETLTVLGGGKVGRIDDFKTLTTYQGGKRRTSKSVRQDMGYGAEMSEFVNAVRGGGTATMPLEHVWASTAGVFAAVESLTLGASVNVTW